MDKSLLPIIAKSVLKKLSNSDEKYVDLYVKGNEYIVLEEKKQLDINGDYITPKGYETSWQSTIIGFNYKGKTLPTLEEIEKCLYNTFVKII